MADARDNPTAPQLQDDIDSGRSGDKTPGFDPAAAPLGTDEEAGGHGPSTQEIAQARAHENRTAAAGERANAAEPGLTPDGAAGRPPSALLWAAGLIVLAALAAAFFLAG